MSGTFSSPSNQHSWYMSKFLFNFTFSSVISLLELLGLHSQHISWSIYTISDTLRSNNLLWRSLIGNIFTISDCFGKKKNEFWASSSWFINEHLSRHPSACVWWCLFFLFYFCILSCMPNKVTQHHGPNIFPGQDIPLISTLIKSCYPSIP